MFNQTPEHLLMDIENDSDSSLDSDDSFSKRQQTGAFKVFSPSELDDNDVYYTDYRKAKKLFKRLHKKTQEMRHEQIQYIINTFKILILFLQVAERLNLYQARHIPN